LLTAGGEARFGAGEYGFVANAATTPERIDVAAATAVYTADELDDNGQPEPVTDGEAEDADSTSWWWAAGLLLLFAL
jgi:hypothetical protein